MEWGYSGRMTKDEKRTGKWQGKNNDRSTVTKVTSVACSNIQLWKLDTQNETRCDAFEMKGLSKILQVSWTAKKTNK